MFEDIGGAWGHKIITDWCRNKSKENRQAIIDFYGHDEFLSLYEDYDPDYFNPHDIVFRSKLEFSIAKAAIYIRRAML